MGRGSLPYGTIDRRRVLEGDMNSAVWHFIADRTSCSDPYMLVKLNSHLLLSDSLSRPALCDVRGHRVSKRTRMMSQKEEAEEAKKNFFPLVTQLRLVSGDTKVPGSVYLGRYLGWKIN